MRNFFRRVETIVRRHSHASALIVITAIVLFCALPLLSPRIPFSEDILNGAARVDAVYKNFGDGQWYLRWIPTMEAGFGYPLFNYYPPFFSYIAAALVPLCGGVISAMYAAAIFFWILSAVCMYEWVRLEYSPKPALVAALVYALAPYHLVVVYIRGSFAEFAAMTFLPACLLSFAYLNKKRNIYTFFFASCAVMLLVISHNSTALISMPFLFAYVLFLVFRENLFGDDEQITRRLLYVLQKKELYVRLIIFFSAIGTGLLMSSFYWLPALAEQSAVYLFKVTEGFYYYTAHFYSVGMMLGFSTGNGDWIGVSMGRIHSILLFILLCIFLQYRKKCSKKMPIVLFWTVLCVVYFFLTMNLSNIVYQIVPLFQTIQFPWRMFSVVSVPFSFLVGIAYTLLPLSRKVRIMLGVLAAYCLVVFMACIVFNSHIYLPNDISREFNTRGGLSSELVYALTTASGIHGVIAEYTPRGAIDVFPEDVLPGELVAKDQGNVVTVLSHTQASGIEHIFAVGAQESATLRFGQYWFPGWTVYVNNATVSSTAGEAGTIDFEIPQGTSDIRIRFEDTPLRRAANRLSQSTFLILLGALLYSLYRERKRRLV